MEPPRKEQGDQVLKQLSRDKPCLLTEGQLETKAPAHGKRKFLDQKTAKTQANAGPNWRGIKLQRSSNWTLANPEIPRKIVKAKRDTRSSKWHKVLFCFKILKGTALEAVCPLSMISITHCPRKGKREQDHRITAQRISIYCPSALHSRTTTRAPKPAWEHAQVQDGDAVTAALPLPEDVTNKVHDNP